MEYQLVAMQSLNIEKITELVTVGFTVTAEVTIHEMDYEVEIELDEDEELSLGVRNSVRDFEETIDDLMDEDGNIFCKIILDSTDVKKFSVTTNEFINSTINSIVGE